MKVVNFNKFVNDFNGFYDTKYKSIQLNSGSICDAMYDLYDTEDFEIDWDKELIELY